MRLTLVRSATVLLELRGRRILVDPMLDDAGTRPPVEQTANPVRNPTVPLPFPAEEVVRDLDAILVTHRHRDHLDARAEELLPRDVPVFCQPEDEEALRDLGFDARPVGDSLDWDGLAIARTPARHGTGRIAELLGPVSGFVLDDLYLAGDTVWYEGVEETIERHRPRVAIVNAAGAEFLDGGLIVMGIDDVREVAARVPVVVAVHLEALNHCFLTRAALREAVPGVLVPEDGETLELAVGWNDPQVVGSRRVVTTICAVVLGFVLPLFLIDEAEIDELTGAYGAVGGILLLAGYLARGRFVRRAVAPADVAVRAAIAGLVLAALGVALVVALGLSPADAVLAMPAAVMFPAVSAGGAVFTMLDRPGHKWRTSLALLLAFAVVTGCMSLAGAIGHAVS